MDISECQSGISMDVCLPQSKTCLGEFAEGRYPTLWSEGDVLSLNGILSKPLAASAAGGNKAEFYFKGDLRSPFNLLYPGTTETDLVEFPKEQAYCSNSFDPAAVPMWSSSLSYENATMKHLSTLLCFSVTSRDKVNISQIQVSAMNGEQLSGKFKMQTGNDGRFTGELIPVDGTPSTSLIISSPCRLGTAPTEFYVSIPHGTYKSGFSALVITDDDKVMNLFFYTKEEGKVIEPSRVVKFETVEFSGETSVVLIKTGEDLLKLGDSTMAGKDAVLVNDIDLSSTDWTPIATMQACFNGAGHRITGINAPFCDALEGKISNLTIEADIRQTEGIDCAVFANKMQDGSEMRVCKAKGRIDLSFAGKQSRDVHLGGLVAQFNGGVIQDSHNEADVRIGNCNSSANVFVGGCIGQSAASSFDGVHNDGKVYVDGDISTGNIFVGGVTGQCKKCAILGNVLHTSPESEVNVKLCSTMGQVMIGGIIGYIYQSGIQCDSLTNKGKVNVEFPSACIVTDFKLGGVIGYCYANSDCVFSFKNAVNQGAVTIKGATLTTAADLTRGSQIGGILGRAQISGDFPECLVSLNGCRNTGDISLVENTGGCYIYQAGILGCCSAYNLEISDCHNTGNLSCEGNTGQYIAGGILATPYRNAVTNVTVSGCTNEGTISYVDKAAQIEHMTVGGIVGNISGNSTSKVATALIDNCTNSGNLLRYNEAKIYNKKQSLAGGILGATSRYFTGTESYVNVTVSNCTNNGTITFNQYTGTDQFIETSTDYSFTGGIVGVAKATTNYEVSVCCCNNNGDILATSGQHGGIIGFMYSGAVLKGTAKSYCTNTGSICDWSLDQKGSGSCIAGGIVGYLKNISTAPCTVEFAWNKGKVCGSTTTTYCVGGIVGKLLDAHKVSKCKNSGDVRNCSAKAAELKLSGAISGTVGTANFVENCGIGGRVMRPSGWVTMAEDFQKYIYNNTEAPSEAAYIGCCFWDGVSELPWEKTEQQ